MSVEEIMVSKYREFIQNGWNFSKGSDSSSLYVKLEKFSQSSYQFLYHCNLEVTNRNGKVTFCKYQTDRESNMKRHITSKKLHKWKNSDGFKEMLDKIQRNKGIGIIFKY